MPSSKKLHVKEHCGRCWSEFIDWGHSQSSWYFRTSFVKCCPSNLISGSSLPPPLPCVNKYTVYTYTVCKGGGVRGHRRGGDVRQKNTCRKVPLEENFLDDDSFLWFLYSLYVKEAASSMGNLWTMAMSAWCLLSSIVGRFSSLSVISSQMLLFSPDIILIALCCTFQGSSWFLQSIWPRLGLKIQDGVAHVGHTKDATSHP